MDFLNNVSDDSSVVVFFYKDLKDFQAIKSNWNMAKKRTKSNVHWRIISCSNHDYVFLKEKYRIKSNSIIGFSPKRNGKRNLYFLLKKATVSNLQLFAETFEINNSKQKPQNIRNKINSSLL